MLELDAFVEFDELYAFFDAFDALEEFFYEFFEEFFDVFFDVFVEFDALYELDAFVEFDEFDEFLAMIFPPINILLKYPGIFLYTQTLSITIISNHAKNIRIFICSFFHYREPHILTCSVF